MHLFDPEGLEFEVKGGRKRKLILGEDMEVVLVEREAGAGDSHSHPNEQVIYFLEGEGEFHVGDERSSIKPGQVLHLPKDIPHGITPHTFMRYVTVYTPAREASRKGLEEGRTGHHAAG